jgi:hypothetical protein
VSLPFLGDTSSGHALSSRITTPLVAISRGVTPNKNRNRFPMLRDPPDPQGSTVHPLAAEDRLSPQNLILSSSSLSTVYLSRRGKASRKDQPKAATFSLSDDLEGPSDKNMNSADCLFSFGPVICVLLRLWSRLVSLVRGWAAAQIRHSEMLEPATQLSAHQVGTK